MQTLIIRDCNCRKHTYNISNKNSRTLKRGLEDMIYESRYIIWFIILIIIFYIFF